ncbi:MAG: polysaccharide export protein, partial [Alphaproteobacteria bacterium]|nr:polysaccharide export protein [Alphaproteobacteria bacterium]
MSLRIDSTLAGALPAFRVFMLPLRLLMLVLGVGAVAMLGGCAAKRGGNIPYEVQGFGTPDKPSTTIGVGDDYKVGPLDTLSIKVFQVADLSGDYEVDLTGTISMPLVGNLKVVDLTPTQIDARITEMLGQKYLQHPDVSVSVKASVT